MDMLTDMQRDHPEILADAQTKLSRVRGLMDLLKLDAVILTRRDQFAWVTSGGDGSVIECSETSFGYLVITPAAHYLVAHRMDGQRLLEEQIPQQCYELVTFRWFDGDLLEYCRNLAGGGNIGCDAPADGMKYIQSELVDLHYPMTTFEVGRYRWLGQATSEMMNHMADFTQPGQTEQEIAAEMRMEHIRRGIDVDVMIVGSDERVFKYRHPMPTSKKLERYIMIHSSARKWGLHANVTRFIHFGPASEQIRRIYHAAATIEGRILLRLAPGLPFSQILEWQKEWYREFGFADEWHNHFQGGPTGYVIADPARCLTSKVVQVNQPYEWFITITGTKAGELTMLTEKGAEVLSASAQWPEITVTENQKSILVPDLLSK
jgi:antitoxin VapB